MDKRKLEKKYTKLKTKHKLLKHLVDGLMKIIDAQHKKVGEEGETKVLLEKKDTIVRPEAKSTNTKTVEIQLEESDKWAEFLLKESVTKNAESIKKFFGEKLLKNGTKHKEILGVKENESGWIVEYIVGRELVGNTTMTTIKIEEEKLWISEILAGTHNLDSVSINKFFINQLAEQGIHAENIMHVEPATDGADGEWQVYYTPKEQLTTI